MLCKNYDEFGRWYYNNYINFYNCQCFDDRLLNEDFEIGQTHLITIDRVIEEDDIKNIDVQG